MHRIYLDQGVMAPATGAAMSAVIAPPTPAAVEALGHLADAYELVVLGNPPAHLLSGLEVPLRSAGKLPSEPAHGSWLITDDPRSCEARPPGLRTVLVGPRRAPTHRPMARCDVEARDLNAAVVEILAREAMG